MRRLVTLVVAVATLVASPLSAQGRVTVNRVELTADILQELTRYGIQVAPGDYWYDAASGPFGLMGGPGVGFTMPNLQLGGPLAADASGGGSGVLTGVFVNGRELHPQDVAALSTLGPVYPGRYWLRFDGWYGFEGGMALGNLIYLAQQASRGGPGYSRSTYFGHVGSDGQTSYFFDPSSGCSVMSGGGGVSC